MPQIDLKSVNSKLKAERRPKQNVSRGQVELAKLGKQVSKLTAKVNQLKTDLKEAREASVKLLQGGKILSVRSSG